MLPFALVRHQDLAPHPRHLHGRLGLSSAAPGLRDHHVKTRVQVGSPPTPRIGRWSSVSRIFDPYCGSLFIVLEFQMHKDDPMPSVILILPTSAHLTNRACDHRVLRASAPPLRPRPPPHQSALVHLARIRMLSVLYPSKGSVRSPVRPSKTRQLPQISHRSLKTMARSYKV